MKPDICSPKIICRPKTLILRSVLSVFSLALILIVSNISTSTVQAQQNFTPLAQGDYEIIEESEFFNPGIQVHGYYEAYYGNRRRGLLNGDNLGGNMFQDISLKMTSKVNTNVAVRAEIGNKSTLLSDQEYYYETNYPDERGDASGDGMTVVFRQAFLEYDHNPNARLRIGKQFINVGDRIGMIYQGNANAITQECRIGTWCYYIGGARLGEEGNSGLYWVQLDYPVYESGNLVPDHWTKKGTRQEVSFNVELLNVRYDGTDIPSSKMGMWTSEHSTYHTTTTNSSSATDYVYFENDGVSYMGFNLGWNYYDFLLNMSWIMLDGKRRYFVGEKEPNKEPLAKRHLTGTAIYLDMDFFPYKNWRVSLTGLSSSGTKYESADSNVWDKNSSSFLEVQKGDFGDAIIYFNGKHGIGDGHSISNLKFVQLDISFLTERKDMGFDFAYYVFQKEQSVFYTEDGTDPKRSADIGQEMDLRFNWRLEDKIDVGAFIAYFNPGKAYSQNDNVTPTGDEDEISLIGIDLKYNF